MTTMMTTSHRLVGTVGVAVALAESDVVVVVERQHYSHYYLHYLHYWHVVVLTMMLLMLM